jgi:S-DNA-T family DNA segregation ATPase FtsK/SpoIIIE
LSLLDVPKKQMNTNQGTVQGNIETLEKVFKDFEIDGKVVEVHVGPSVTQYEIELKAGTKVNRVLSINREIALALAAKDVRIQAPIPGKNTIGVEIPNRVNTIVSLRDIMANMPNSYDNSKLAVGLGKDIMGKPSYVEINKTPHLLVAGATGSGKSVCINTIIISILMRCRPDEVKLILVDPKKVELSIYNGVPHLLSPVVTDSKKAAIALMKIVSEMESRYDLFSETETKNIVSYNHYIDEKNKYLSDNEKKNHLPYIVVIIDELADLMLVAAKEVEDSIMRITQMARAAGIHLIVATQRPSTDVVTGIIKANIPSRISFAVSSNVDSRTIMDQGGAEKLLGKGDMLFLPMGENVPIRLQGCFVSDEEVKRVVDYTVKQQKAQYDERLTVTDEKVTSLHERDAGEDDPLYNEIVEFAVKSGKISASLIQRKYRFGYNRAARIIDILEGRGIIGPANGSKPREVLVKLEENNEEEDGV